MKNVLHSILSLSIVVLEFVYISITNFLWNAHGYFTTHKAVPRNVKSALFILGFYAIKLRNDIRGLSFSNVDRSRLNLVLVVMLAKERTRYFKNCRTLATAEDDAESTVCIAALTHTLTQMRKVDAETARRILLSNF